MSFETLPHDEKFLHQRLLADPSDWDTRRRLAHALYDRDAFLEAAETIWQSEQIPNIDVDLAFAARVLSKAQPRRAIRLLTAVLEMNRGKAVQNLGMANALLHHGLVLQAVRFYGAALEVDSSLVNPELEHFILWTDDEMRLWADFTDRRPKLGDLPWIVRDPKEALKLTQSVSLHTTPIFVPKLPAVPGEQLTNVLYRQDAEKNAKITPPPAVTIPIDRVDPKHRRFDDKYGATSVSSGDARESSHIAGRSPTIRPMEAAPAADPAAALDAPIQVPVAQPVHPSYPAPAAQQNIYPQAQPQPVYPQAVPQQYQPAAAPYQPVIPAPLPQPYQQAPQPQYQVPQPQYQPVQPQYQPVQPQYQPVQPQYQPVQPQYQPVQPQPVATMPIQPTQPLQPAPPMPPMGANSHLFQTPPPAVTRRMLIPSNATGTQKASPPPGANIKFRRP